MGLFDFITGDDFRMCLEDDYRELSQALKDKSWKTVHVLAGSIIEAVLIDYLVASDYQARTGKDPLRLDLSEAISTCVSEKMLSPKIGELANVIRHYRNLIHPGRIIRLGETADSNSATIANALIEMIVSELATKRRQTYGYTAEQIVSKIEKDPAATSFVSHLLRDTNKFELKRLLIDILPTRYMELPPLSDDAEEVWGALESTFRLAMDLAPADVRTAVVERYMTILKEESGGYVVSYEDAFLRATDLRYLSSGDLELAKEHLLSRLKRDNGMPVLRIVERGLPPVLEYDELEQFVDFLVRAMEWNRNPEAKLMAKNILEALSGETSTAQDREIGSRLDDWVLHLEKLSLHDNANVVREIRAALYPPAEFSNSNTDDDVPL